MISMKLLAKTFLYKTRIYKLGLLKNNFHILPYHMIVEQPTGFYPETALKTFEKQMVHIARNYTVVDLNDLVDRVKHRESLRGLLAITFDDGFRDNYEMAFPILKKYNLPATIFLATEYIESGKPPWFITFRQAFMSTRKTRVDLSVGETHLSLSLETPRERIEAGNRVMAEIRRATNDIRLALLSTLFEKLGAEHSPDLDGMMLTWDHIREMSSAGISFGAHTVSHPVLSRVSLETAEKEILTSREVIESKIQKPVTTFAYPFGKTADYTPPLIPVLEKYHFNCAVTTETDINHPDTSLFSLNRNYPWETAVL